MQGEARSLGMRHLKWLRYSEIATQMFLAQSAIVRSPRSQATLRKHEKTLMALFDKWADIDAADKPARVVSCRDAILMMQRMGFIGTGITHRECRNVRLTLDCHSKLHDPS